MPIRAKLINASGMHMATATTPAAMRESRNTRRAIAKPKGSAAEAIRIDTQRRTKTRAGRVSPFAIRRNGERIQ